MLGAVRNFGACLDQCSAAERPNLPRLVPYSKCGSPPELVKQPSALVSRRQSRFRKQFSRIFRFQKSQQQIAATRGITDSKSRDRILIEAAILEIRQRRFSF